MKWCVVFILFLLKPQSIEAEDDGNHTRHKRVIGGYNSPDGLFPFVASLQINKYGFYMHFCGSAIISERYIISSAHCMFLQEGMRTTCYKAKYLKAADMTYDLIAVVGTNKLTGGTGHIYFIESFVYHSEFGFKLGINDISLLRTATTIQFNDYVRPINIYNLEVPVGARVIVAGWGLTSFPGELSNTLKFIDLRTTSYSDCIRYWKKIYRSQICTFTESGEGVCTSDSGGPLVYKGNLIGLVSFGKPCAVGYPDVFTNVTHEFKWIVYNIKCLAEPHYIYESESI